MDKALSRKAETPTAASHSSSSRLHLCPMHQHKLGQTWSLHLAHIFIIQSEFACIEMVMFVFWILQQSPATICRWTAASSRPVVTRVKWAEQRCLYLYTHSRTWSSTSEPSSLFCMKSSEERCYIVQKGKGDKTNNLGCTFIENVHLFNKFIVNISYHLKDCIKCYLK